MLKMSPKCGDDTSIECWWYLHKLIFGTGHWRGWWRDGFTSWKWWIDVLPMIHKCALFLLLNAVTIYILVELLSGRIYTLQARSTMTNISRKWFLVCLHGDSSQGSWRKDLPSYVHPCSQVSIFRARPQVGQFVAELTGGLPVWIGCHPSKVVGGTGGLWEHVTAQQQNRNEAKVLMRVPERHVSPIFL